MTKTKFYWTNLHNRKDGKVKDEQIKVKAQGSTHVWMKRDGEGAGQANAPFYFRKVTGDFEASVKVTSKMEHWLDQAGILLREKLGVYTKVGLEFHDDPTKAGNPNYYAAAYVHPKSQLEMYDNLTPYPGQFKRPDKKYDFAKLEEKDPEKKVEIWLKVSRKGKCVEAQYSLNGEEWMDLRPEKSKFTSAKSLSVGIFAASGLAESDGIKVTFDDLKIEEDPDWVDQDYSDEEDEVKAKTKAPVEESDDLGRTMQEKAEEEMMARLSALQAGLSGDVDDDADEKEEEAQADAGVSGVEELNLDLDLDLGLDEDIGIVDVDTDVGGAGGLDDFEEQMRKMEELRQSLAIDVPELPPEIEKEGDDGDEDEDEDFAGLHLVDTSVSDVEEDTSTPQNGKKVDSDSDDDDDSDSDDDSE